MRFLLTLLLLIPGLALASVGEIGKVKGSGAIERGSDSIPAIDGVGIMMQDTAVTAAGKIQIDFLDDTRVDITEHSRLLIDEFVYDRLDRHRQQCLDLVCLLLQLNYCYYLHLQ